ncbi:uncharacterized protein [Sinocyclocheilus grahami]|uniref:Uncharacterized LOC107563632 n=1 Tax=Sinocyclocheilus grahami TaxID=75366 RepID=A0A672PEV7_SINGR|nr:PREDICTED: uncharacterized protein LOC107563632 isoform X2 [Sinocyclocheilus grahami]
MASSNALRPQNRSQQDHSGILKHQELKTKRASSKRGSENLDPSAFAETGKGVGKLKGVSRLPVLAKSLQPALSELSQNPSHNRLEQSALTSKAQKKRIYTKPVPFNLSQSRTHNQRNAAIPLGKAALTPSTRLTPGEKVRNLNQSAKTETSSNKAMTSGVLRAQANKSHQQHPSSHAEYVASNKDSSDVHPSSHESGCCSHTDLSSRLDVNSDNQAPKDKHCLPSTTQSHVNTKAVHNVLPCEGSSAFGAQCMMPRLSTCPPGPGTFNNLPQRVVKKSHSLDGIADKSGPFSPDPSALRSILQSDGMRLGEHIGATPRASTCPGRGTSIYSAQRVPAKKTQTEAPAEAKSPTGSAFSPDPSALRVILQFSGTTPHAPTGLTGRATSVYSAQRVPVRKPQTDDSAAVKVPAGRVVSFSPDPAALRSILLNEGVRAGGATPRVSTCPTGRGTPIYSAQRVPVKKNKPEVVAAATSSPCANRTPVMKWTPQRVANTKPQSVRKLCTAQKMSSLRGSPGLHEAHNPSTGLLVCQEGEDVVQRLFEDQEQMNADQLDQDDITSQQLLNSHQTTETQSTIKENSDSNHCHTKDEGKKTAQPFIQAAHRGTVIVFSSSQRLGSDRSQDTLKTPGTGHPLQLFEGQLASHNALPLQSDQSNGSQINPSLDLPKQSQSKDPTVTHSTAVSALRRRHTPLEEMFLHEECATYTSRRLSCPLQPRCGNPVAATLLFQDSTCFLPIGLSSPVRLSPVPSGSSIRA